MRFRPLLTSPLLASLALLAPAGQDGARAQQPIPALESPIITWTNYYRQRQGLGPLELNPQLTQMARMHAWHMASREEMAHELDGSTLVERARRAGYAYHAVGENVAYNEGYNDPAWKFFDGWMRSPSHWQNIVGSQYSEIGVGVYRSPSGKFYACQVFGSPRGGSPPPQQLFAAASPALPSVPAYYPQPTAAGGMPMYAGLGAYPGRIAPPSPVPPAGYNLQIPERPTEFQRQLGFAPNYELADQEFFPYTEFGTPNWTQNWTQP